MTPFETIGSLVRKNIDELRADMEKQIGMVLDLVKAGPQEGKAGRDGEKGQDGQDGSDGAPGLDGAGIDQDMWQPGIYRKGTLVQHNFGQFFLSECDTGEEPGVGKEWQRVGRMGFKFLASWNADTVFNDGDLFVKNFGLMIHVNGENKLIVGRGPKGLRGEKGEKGEPGKIGAPGQVLESASIDGFVFKFVFTDGTNQNTVEVDIEKQLNAMVVEHVNKVLNDVIS